MHFTLADLAGKTMASDSTKGISADIAIRWSCMGCSVPVMVPGKAVWLVGLVEAALRGGSEGAEPVLHFAAGLGAQHQGSERGDHLE